MSDPKLKSENYQNLGGINTKVSPYMNRITEFLNLINFDFTKPGSLTSRPGTTMYVGATMAGRVTGIHEYVKQNGSSYLLTFNNDSAFLVNSSGFSALGTSLALGSTQLYSIQTFVDWEFFANQDRMYKFNGSSLYFWSLPSGWIWKEAGGATPTVTEFKAVPVVGGGLSGNFFAGYGYKNIRGFYGSPNVNPEFIDPLVFRVGGTTLRPEFGYFVSLNGVTFGSIGFTGMTVVPGYGITSYSFYRSRVDETQMYHLADAASLGGGFVDTGTTYALGDLAPDFLPIDYDFRTLFSVITSTGYPTSTFVGWPVPYKPKIIEIFSNRMFMGGFKSLTNVVDGTNLKPFVVNAESFLWFSDLAEPEGIPPENFIEIRTNDGDKIACLKSYLASLVVFKEKSFHLLTGDSPETFSLREISNQYGCVSPQGAVVFENTLYFIDQKGICQFNGANVNIISSRIEPTFQTMNLAAAGNSVALHVKERNEVWFAIPTGSSTVNNTLIVYDYLSEALTVWQGVNISYLARVQQRLSRPKPFAGGYTGAVSYFDETVYSDLGSGITYVAKSRFLADMGNSVTKQFRRFYLDSDYNGYTVPVTVNLYQDYGSSLITSQTMNQTEFQKRIDFGVPAKSLSAEMVASSSTATIRINGFTIEFREQRRV